MLYSLWFVRWAAGLARGAAVHSCGAWAVQATSSSSWTQMLRLRSREGEGEVASQVVCGNAAAGYRHQGRETTPCTQP